MISRIDLEGNISYIRELKTYKKRDGSDGHLINFNIAVNDSKRRPDGTWNNDITTFFSCILSDKKAEAFNATFKVGDRVVLGGDLRVKEPYTDKNGIEHSGELEVSVDKIGYALHYRPMEIDRSNRTSSASSSAPSYKKKEEPVSSDIDFTVGDSEDEWSSII